MCGIIAVLRRRSRRTAPSLSALQSLLTEAERAFAAGRDHLQLGAAADALLRLDRELKGVPGLWALLQHQDAVPELTRRLQAMQQELHDHERSLDAGAVTDDPDPALELRNQAIVRLKDGLWALLRDRLPHCLAVCATSPTATCRTSTRPPRSRACRSHSAPSIAWRCAGRDSAGISVIVTGIAADRGELHTLQKDRDLDPLFQDGSVRLADGCLNFVYKHAAEIGELGDNTKALRASMRADRLLQAALRTQGAEALVLGHTRWASVGIISEPNAHPLNHEESDDAAGPYVIGALNGDVDNHHELIRQNSLHISDPITTDAKVIPTLVSRQLRSGLPLAEAFRRTVAAFEGSVAIAGPRRRAIRTGWHCRCAAAARRSTSAPPRTRSSWPVSRTA